MIAYYKKGALTRGDVGMALLIALGFACGSFFVLAVVFFQYNLAWAILLGSAAIDGLLYLFVGDVIICYRCGARHVGPKVAFSVSTAFELVRL